MRGVRAGGLFVAGVLLLAGGCSAEFAEFTSEEGKFKVLMPGTPKEQSQSIMGATMKAYGVEERNGAYVASYADLPVPEKMTDEEIQERLDGSREGMLRNINAKLVEEKKITLAGKYPGREVTADLPNDKGVVRNRIYLVGKRLYQVMVVGTRSWANSADADKFLNSFELTQ